MPRRTTADADIKKNINGGTPVAAPHLLHRNGEVNKMKFALLGAAAVAATALVSPLKAQEVISNPGYCAQFYPDANCQNKGPGNPYTGSYQAGNWENRYAYMDRGHMDHREHRRWHRGDHHHH